MTTLRMPLLASTRPAALPLRARLRCSVVPALCRPKVAGSGPALVVAPHPDDETLGCGGVIALKRQRGVPVTVVFLTGGGRCLGELPEPEERALIAARRVEAIAALTHLGVPEAAVHFLDYPDGGLATLPEPERAALQSRLAALVQAAAPDEVYVPHRHDFHPDHEAANRVVGGAVRAAGRSPVFFEYPIWILWGGGRAQIMKHFLRGDLARGERITLDPALIEVKRAAVAEYRSQLPLMPFGFVDCFLRDAEIFFRVGAAQ
jgi:LmbE family N-acetylglucosaminyl deacetylase